MRHRRWVVVVAVVVIGVLPLLLLTLKVGSRHPAVKRAVLARILPTAAGHISVGELDVGLASIRLGDVTIEPTPSVHVRIPQATVQLHYGKLIASRFDVRRSLGTVLVTSPRVIITAEPTPRPIEAPAHAPLDLASIERIVPSYLGASDGTVVFRNPASGESLVVGAIDLLIEREGDAAVRGSASGSALGGEGNLRADLDWDLASDSLSVSGKIDDATLGDDFFLPFATSMPSVSGHASATFRAVAGRLSSPSASATFALAGGRLQLPGELGTVADLSAEGEFDGDVLSVTRAGGRWGQATVKAAGALDLRDREFRDVAVEASSVALGTLAGLGLAPHGLEGTLDATALVSGGFSEPSVRAAGTAAEVRAGRVRLSNVDARGTFVEGSVAVESFRARAFGGSIAASGSVEMGKPGEPWRFDLKGEADGLAAKELVALAGGAAAAGAVSLKDLSATGTSDRPEIESFVYWNGLTLGAVRLGNGAGGFLFRNGTLAATATAHGGAVTASGEVRGFFGGPAIDAEISFTSARAESLFVFPKGLAPPVVLDGSLHAVGPAGAVSLDGSLSAVGREGRATLEIDGTLEDALGEASLALSVDAPDAVVRGIRVPMHADATLDRSELSVPRLELGSLGEAHGRLGLAEPHPIQAGLVVSETRLPDLLALVTGRPAPAGVDGLVFASVSFQGTLREPSAEGQIEIANAQALGVTDLDASLVASLGRGIATIDELTLAHRGQRVASATGTADLDGEMAVSVTGEGVPGPLLGGSAETVFDLSLGLGGETRRPTLDGRIESSRGEFLGIAFDGFSARLSGAEGNLSLDRLTLEQRESYRMTAEGRIPAAALPGGDGSSDASITVDVAGDPFDFLAQLLPFVESAEGSGTMRLHLVGKVGDFTIANAWLDATASRLVPRVLFEKLEDVRAHVIVSDGAVVEGTVEASVGGDSIRLESRRDVLIRDRPADPLVVGGIDLGVLALSTDVSGVRASVPGLMLPEGVGRVAIRGRDAPAFLIAGPAGRPILSGEIELSDTEFRYPFPSSEQGLLAGLFGNAEWALRMVAGRSLWYWRPDASLEIERGGALDFAGVPSEDNLCVSGRLESTRGTVTYMQSDFDVRQAFVEFPPFCEPPRFYAEATTRVEDGTTITLTMNSFESAFALAAPGAPLDETALRLASDSPDDRTQEDVLSRLQYGGDVASIPGEEQATLERRKAIEVIGAQIGSRVVRPLLSPIEGRLKRGLRLDLVRMDIDFVEHFLSELDQWYAQEGGTGYRPFLPDSRITLGKYVAHDWLVSYVGHAETFEETIGDQRLGLRHEIGIEYEVSRNTSLSLRAVYDPSLAGWDRRVTVENRFEF